MSDSRKISLCLTTYNRYDLTIKCFIDVIDDNRISQVIILDDQSTDGSYERLCEYYKDIKKVTIFRTVENIDCYHSKALSINYAHNNFAILLDSDNVINTKYIDALFEIEDWQDDVFYQPSWAMPEFDFRRYEGKLFTKNNISEYIEKPQFETMLNAMNFFVNKHQYLRAYKENENPITSDSIFINYQNFKNGGKMYVVPNLYYYHRIHEGSHYRQNHKKTKKGFHENIILKLKELK